MTDRKYVIYQNDLKFRNMRNLDKLKIDWSQNNISHLYDINHDTLEFRFDESKQSNNKDLDLRHLNLLEIPTQINIYFLNNLQYLFLSHNKLSGKIDFSKFINLISLDLDNNNITEIILPQKLIELSINNNSLSLLNCNKNLVRLKLSHNKLNNILLSVNLEILEIDNNNFTNIDISNLSLLKRFIVYSNPLNNITFTPSIEYADISETNISEIICNNVSHNLEHLVANTCKNLKDIPKFNKLKNLELINTPIDKLYYYDNFELIIVQFNLTKNISKKYEENGANIQIRKNTLLVISKNSVINIINDK
jgi:Leucine-rich repeat (LRR) protein